MKLALHRSLTFWSGLLVMAFMIWAWNWSRSFMAYLQFGGNPEYELGLARSAVHLGITTSGTKLREAPNFHDSSGMRLPLLEGPTPWLGKWAHQVEQFPDSGLHLQRLSVPCWILVFAWGCLCILLLLWRYRRFRTKGQLIPMK